MKKSINLILLVILTILLSSCITSQDEVNKAKQNLWIIKWWNVINNSVNNVENKINNSEGSGIEKKIDNSVNSGTGKEIIQDSIKDIEKDIAKNKVKNIEIKSLTNNQLLKFDDLSNANLLSWEVEITWTTLWKVDKIVVTFRNDTSDFPNDNYKLQTFVPWADTFLYRAFSRYQTLDFWKNIYVFTAYSWKEVTKLELTLNVFKKDEKDLSDKTQKNYEAIDISKLPSNEVFWNPTELWNGKIWYSDLNWLEIKKDIKSWLTCENVTSILAEDVSWYFYRNTCRPIKSNEWISFFVLRLDWDKYFYEKHYYLPYQWLYWVQELKTWTWVTSVNIWEKNTELKWINDNFGILKISDDLFKEILK